MPTKDCIDTGDLRLNGICPYFTMFPLEFPVRQLRRAAKEDWVLDPFCGRGTTNFAARILGLRTVGIDTNPVAAAIASAKLVSVSPSEITELACAIVRSRAAPSEVPTGEFWAYCYHEETLADICKFREFLSSARSHTAKALRALLLGALHGPMLKGLPSYFSNQMPRTYATKPNGAVRFWRRHKLHPRRVDVVDVIRRKATYFFSMVPKRVPGCIFLGDSRSVVPTLGTGRFKWVITSPPYVGMRTYVPDQWIRNWFVGGPPEVDYEQRSQLGVEGKQNFITQLSEVWRAVADICAPGAHLIVRFGALPSATQSPAEIVRASLEASAKPWKIRTYKNAGHASLGKRQATQFQLRKSRPLQEIDVHAVLES